MPRHCSRPVAVLIALAVALLPSDLWAVVSFTFLAEERGPEPGTTLAGAIDVFVVGDYAYVANSERWSLAVLDISNPNDPIFVAEELGPSWDSFFGAGDVFVQGSYAYVAVGGDGASLAVIDISKLADPQAEVREGPIPVHELLSRSRLRSAGDDIGQLDDWHF